MIELWTDGSLFDNLYYLVIVAAFVWSAAGFISYFSLGKRILIALAEDCDKASSILGLWQKDFEQAKQEGSDFGIDPDRRKEVRRAIGLILFVFCYLAITLAFAVVKFCAAISYPLCLIAWGSAVLVQLITKFISKRIEEGSAGYTWVLRVESGLCASIYLSLPIYLVV